MLVFVEAIHVFSIASRPPPHAQSHAHPRARIVSSRAFRRLAHKTQVISQPPSDHVSTRMTHTLEVASLAREIAERLVRAGRALDLDLVESIALAHDVGHPPFGHAGEAALAKRAANAGLGGFHHASFGVRLLSRLEHDAFTVPIVTSESILDGVLAHSKGKAGAPFARCGAIKRRSFEAHVVRAADLYAYASVDLDDAFFLGIFRPDSLPGVAARVLGRSGADVRRVLVDRTVAATLASADESLRLDDETDAALAELRAFLYERFYEGPPTVEQTKRADEIIGTVWRAFELDLCGALDAVGWARREEPSGRATLRDALDAVACMTDRFAVAFAEGRDARRCRS